MSDPLLTIGAFARAVGLTATALRHYDECGLLPPAEVDDVTGYRYYTPELAERARLVARLREAGMSIAVMRSVLDGDPDQRRAVVQRFVEEQAARSARTAAVLDDVLAALEAPGPRSTSVGVRGPELAAALRQVRAAADHDATSPLAAVLIDVAEGSLDVVATNRYWMAVRTLPVDEPVDEARVVLGLAAAGGLAADLDRFDTAVLTVTDERVTLGGRSYDGRSTPYPAHRMLLAGLEPPATRAVLARDGLVAAVEAAGRAEVMVALDAGGAHLVDDGGARDCSVDATVSGPEVTVRLGSALLLR
ncbi:MAG: MerR family transcriptional regulator, partial [Nocardioidaceae bacterium]|nr:MerR family transcriptional regulator [Nocardioidaceae bacterium]